MAQLATSLAARRSDELQGARPPSCSYLPVFEGSYQGLPREFEIFRDSQRTLSQSRYLLEMARAEIAYFTERLFNHSSDHLEAIGAVYFPNPEHSPLKGFASRLPQHLLKRAFVSKIFHETLMTHPSIAVAYQLIQRAGLKTAAGDRFPENHPLLQVSGGSNGSLSSEQNQRAITYEDFGFSARIPQFGDQITESTTQALSRGATLTWINHQFPSQYIMGSAMPELWSDMSLAAGAKMFMLMITPCDGAVATPEQQLVRYRSAKELIFRDPTILDHPNRDLILPNGDTMKDFLTSSALRHLGAALKPGKKIVDNYRELIQDEGCRVVEVYDPGSTNLLLDSVKRLRDEYGEELVILAGRIPPDADLDSLLAYVTELNKERVTLRVGIAEGKICSTHEKSGGMAPLNFQTAARIIQHSKFISQGSGHQVIVSVEGGASKRLQVAAAAGIAGVSISGSLAGTVLEHIPCLHEFSGRARPYGGEASPVVKIAGRRVNALGEPNQVEGVSGSVARETNWVESLSSRLHGYLVGASKGIRFMRQDSFIGVLTDPTFGAGLVEFSSAANDQARLHL
jgi:hypothetical protein